MYYRLPLHLLFKIILNTIVKIQKLEFGRRKGGLSKKKPATARFAAKELLI